MTVIIDRNIVAKPPIWLESEHFTAKLTEKGNLRISRKESRYLFFEREETGELLDLVKAVADRMREESE